MMGAMMGRVVFLLSVSFLLLSSGCATLFSQKEDTITIKTEPPGAEVYEGTTPLGTTPLTHTFKRDTFKQIKVNIRKEGFKTGELELRRTLDKTALWNLGYILTTGGITSWGIDATTGAMIEYDPKSYYIDLEPINRAPTLSERGRRNRMAFVLFNHHRLKSDIARGEGEYLSAYYRISDTAEPYRTFLQRIRKEAPALLSKEDGADFYRYLEEQWVIASEGPSGAMNDRVR